eukprot:gene25139-31560_t
MIGDDNLPIDYDFHCDERLLRMEGEIVKVDETENGTFNDSGDGLNKNGDPQKHQPDQAFYIDTYTDESVQRLLGNIEALHLEPSASFCEDGEYDEDQFEELPSLDKQVDGEASDDVIEIERPGTADSTVSGGSSRPRSRNKLVRYDTTFRPSSAVHDISVLTNDSKFDLSADATITMQQLDYCVFRNSRRFGPKFDAKVERKKVILKEEADRRKRASGQAVAKKVERLAPVAQNRAFGNKTKSITSLLMAVEAAREAAVLAAVAATVDAKHNMVSSPTKGEESGPFRRHLNPLMPVTPQSIPKEGKVSWNSVAVLNSGYRLNLTPISSPTATKKSHSLSSTPTYELRQVHSARKAPKHADQYTEKSLATANLTQAFEEVKRALLDPASVNPATAEGELSDDELAVVKVTDLRVEDALPTIVFDLTEKGAISQVLLKSQQAVPRPNSASKAQRSTASRTETAVEKEKSAKSVQSLLSLAQRRRQYLKPVKRSLKSLMAINPISNEQADVERRALITLFEYCGGRNWVDRTNWCSDEPVKKWFGVGVTVEGYVFELDLSDNNLTGEFPDSIYLLAKLEVAIFDNNRLHGALPDYALSKMPSLVVLSAQHNQLTGTIPFNMLADLTRLTDLWLSHNQFTGDIQDGIEKLVSLSNLCLYNNQLRGDIPPSICRLYKMEFLSLGNNQLTGPIPHEIISLHCHPVAVPDWLETIPYLEELELFGNSFTGWVPNNVKDLAVKGSAEKKKTLL